MTKPAPPSPPIDRRRGQRRQLEGNPPGKHERRRGVEARQPEVVELDMSNSEWMSLSDLPSQNEK